MISYEQLLDRDFRWALKEGSLHFEKESAVHRTLQSIVKKLDELGVPYAVAGSMAMFFHGFRRFTENVDVLVSREGLQKIHAELEGRGYLPPFTGSKELRDTDTGVRIEFLVAGEYPGDGKPKPVAFPDPASHSVEVDGIRCVNLPCLVEMKLTSGMSSRVRLKALADVLELIQILNLPADFADQLDPSVRGKYSELWTLVATHRPDPS
jgi:hypothetical protein